MDFTKLIILSLFAGLVFSGELQATEGRRLLTIPGFQGLPGIPATFLPFTPSTGIPSLPSFPLPAGTSTTPTFTGIVNPPVVGTTTP
ncbi:hypothetical protein R6Q59_012746 [Mikania micrantha]